MLAWGAMPCLGAAVLGFYAGPAPRSLEGPDGGVASDGSLIL
jgi:hypothetical protein